MTKASNKNSTFTIKDGAISQFVQAINRFLTHGQTQFEMWNKAFTLEHAYGEKWQLIGPDGHVCWFEKDLRGNYMPA